MQASALTLQHYLDLVHGLHLRLVVFLLVLTRVMHCLTLLKKLAVAQTQLLSATPTRQHQQTLVTHTLFLLRHGQLARAVLVVLLFSLATK
jgi:hypothetical protein